MIDYDPQQSWLLVCRKRSQHLAFLEIHSILSQDAFDGDEIDRHRALVHDSLRFVFSVELGYQAQYFQRDCVGQFPMQFVQLFFIISYEGRNPLAKTSLLRLTFSISTISKIWRYAADDDNDGVPDFSEQMEGFEPKCIYFFSFQWYVDNMLVSYWRMIKDATVFVKLFASLAKVSMTSGPVIRLSLVSWWFFETIRPALLDIDALLREFSSVINWLLVARPIPVSGKEQLWSVKYVANG